MKKQENIDINSSYAEYLKECNGIKLYDNRKKQEIGLSDEIVKKIRDHFSKNYGKEAPKDEYLLNTPYTSINITNNPHSYADSMCLEPSNGKIVVENIEGETQNGELDYDYNHSKCPNFDMGKVQVAVIGQPDSSGQKLSIYIPDIEKEEIGEYIKKYEKAFIEEDEEILYKDNIEERKAEVIDMSHFGIEQKEVGETNKSKVSIENLDRFSKNASRKEINEFLNEAIKEINSRDKEL